MNLIHILSRIRNLLLHPAQEWPVIASENKSRKEVFRQFVLPLLCLISITIIIGSTLSTPRTVFSVAYVICRVAFFISSLGIGLYISSYLIAEIMSRQLGGPKYARIFSLMAYSCGPAFLVIAVVELFPFFSELIILSLYSCYLYWKGIPAVLQIQGQKQTTMTILSLVIIAVVFCLAFYFFGHIFRALFIE